MGQVFYQQVNGLWNSVVKIRLAYKIFVAFLLTSFMVVALMVGIMQFYVSRQFADYVNQTALDRLSVLTTQLAAEYQAHRGWQRLQTDPDLWDQMLREALPQTDLDRSASPSAADESSRPAPAALSGTDQRNPIPTDSDEIRSDRLHRHLHRLARALVLFDADVRQIAGGPLRGAPDNYTLQEIVVGGRAVGWLGLPKRERQLSPLDVSFLKEQSVAFYLIGGGILLMAAIVSFLLSRHFLSPVRRLTEGTRALAEFKFDTKIDVRAKDELGQLAADFNQMAQTLKKYEQLRRQWVSDISHELRTPLAILKGEIEALQDGVRQLNQTNLESLHAEVQRLSKLVEDLHQLSLADSQSLMTRNDPVKPLEILSEMVAHFHNRLARRDIETILELSASEAVTVKGDADRLAQLFSNLLENTVNHTDSPGRLKIFENHTAETLKIYFDDSGPGVPREALERLFDRLYRVDKSRSRKMGAGGSGLGLAICKQIVESHGGHIRAANAPSGGLRIEVELPVWRVDRSTLVE
jgi:two-component system sensor histidine kinase BaeS